jgi:hypothetical protein
MIITAEDVTTALILGMFVLVCTIGLIGLLREVMEDDE